MDGLTATESAFLERSRKHGRGARGPAPGTGSDLFGKDFEDVFNGRGDPAGDGSDGGGEGGGGGGGGGAATINALRDRLAAVEAENSSLRARSRRAEEERAAEAARGEKAGRRLAQVKRGPSRGPGWRSRLPGPGAAIASSPRRRMVT